MRQSVPFTGKFEQYAGKLLSARSQPVLIPCDLAIELQLSPCWMV